MMLFLAASLFFVQPAPPGSSASPPAVAEPDITVETDRPTAASRTEARAYVRGTGTASGVTPAARWTQPVCPKVIGLEDALATRVADRVRAAATRAGIAVATPGCQTNILISFVQDAPAIAQKIRARAPRRLSELDPHERDKLTEGDAAIRWWYQSVTAGRDGGRMNDDASPGTGGGEGGRSPLDLGVPVNRIGTSSLITTQVARGLRTATVLVDVDLATGRLLDDVADYAAFVSLAEVRPADPPPANSVLSLFSSTGPRGLSETDERFLAALYQIPLDRDARRQRGLLSIAVDPANGHSKADTHSNEGSRQP